MRDISLYTGESKNQKRKKGIQLYSPEELVQISQSAALVRDLLNQLQKLIKPGINELDIDIFCENYILLRNGEPFLKSSGLYEHSVLISRNNKAFHGIPEDHILQSGDIVTVDIVVIRNGWFGDGAETFTVGECDAQSIQLIDFSRQVVLESVSFIEKKRNLELLSGYFHDKCTEKGYRIIEEGAGHGIGRNLHEEPFIIYGKEPDSCPLEVGMAFTIEPVITDSLTKLNYEEDGTALLEKGAIASQFEYMVAVMDDGLKILTEPLTLFK